MNSLILEHFKYYNFMNKSMFLWAFVAFTALFTSCSDSTSSDAETFADESIVELETRTRTGRGGCFELVFPVTIVLPDGTKAEVTSYKTLREEIRTWRQNNPDADRKVRPQFDFPIDVITKDGETVTIASSEEFRALHRDCKRGGNGHGKGCFKLNFPLSVNFPNGTTQTFEDGKLMRRALHDWKKANTNATSRPQLVFPISITLEDGSVQTVNTKEELRAIKEDCK